MVGLARRPRRGAGVRALSDAHASGARIERPLARDTDQPTPGTPIGSPVIAAHSTSGSRSAPFGHTIVPSSGSTRTLANSRSRHLEAEEVALQEWAAWLDALEARLGALGVRRASVEVERPRTEVDHGAVRNQEVRPEHSTFSRSG